MFITCITLKSKDEIKEMSTELREAYKMEITNEFHRHRTGVQENPFQDKKLKETSSEHMTAIVNLLDWMEKKCL